MGGQLLSQLLHLIGIVPLDHHPHQWLSAGGSQQDAATITQRLLDFSDSALHFRTLEVDGL